MIPLVFFVVSVLETLGGIGAERNLNESSNYSAENYLRFAVGANLSFGDGDSVTVKWTEGGEEKSLEVTPKATTPERMDFDAVDAFDEIPDDTELTFEFELSGESVEGETRIVGA